MRSYRPEELFDERGRARAGAAASCRPSSYRRMSANPHANGGLLLRDLALPDFRDYAVEVAEPGATSARGDPRPGRLPARRDRRQPRHLPPLRTRRDGLQPARRRVRGHRPRRSTAQILPTRRPPRARRPRHGGPLRAPLPGLAGGLPAHRPARPLQLLRGVHPHRRLDVQPARQVAEGEPRHPLAAAHRLAQLPALLARLAAGPQRLLPPGSRASSTTW